MKKKNRGFTLVELVIVIAIFSVLLGVLVPSLNSILGFREQSASSSVQTALDKTKTEAMNRLVGEMVLSHEADGFYITYYLYRGKSSTNMKDSTEKIAAAGLSFSFTTCSDSSGKKNISAQQELSVGEQLIITYDRESGGFRPLQTGVMTQEEVARYLDGNGTQGQDIVFKDGDTYLKSITVNGHSGNRVIIMNPGTGSYTVTVGS